MGNAPVILYIEDNPDNRKLVSRILKAAGFTIHGVADAPTALAFVQSHTPDLILIDIQLAGTDGYTLTRRLRELDRLARTPIVALTANVMEEDRKKSIAAGCDGFIIKPISVDHLSEQIQAYLTHS